MKAIHAALPIPLIAALLLAACAGPRRTPQPVPAPVVAPVIRPAPVPAPHPAGDWRDAPQTAGTWIWALTGGRSTASFGTVGAAPVLILACDRAAASVSLSVPSAGRAGPLVVTTTAGTRALAATATAAGLATSLPARDPLLDRMAFSRGRFMVEAPGLGTLFVPSWPEVGRVIEDCR